MVELSAKKPRKRTEIISETKLRSKKKNRGEHKP